MNADQRFAELGLSLPTIPAMPGRVQPMLEPLLVHGNLAYLSGIGPVGVIGVVGGDCSVEDGYAAARTSALLMLRRIHDAFGSLEVVDKWIKVLGFIRSAPGFAEQPAVLNGFSSLIIDVYGIERGRCARSAIGTNELPANIPVEVEAIVALRASHRKERDA